MVVKFAGRAATPAYRQRIATVKRELTQFGALINPQFQPQTIKRKCLGKVQPMKFLVIAFLLLMPTLALAQQDSSEPTMKETVEWLEENLVTKAIYSGKKGNETSSARVIFVKFTGCVCEIKTQSDDVSQGRFLVTFKNTDFYNIPLNTLDSEKIQVLPKLLKQDFQPTPVVFMAFTKSGKNSIRYEHTTTGSVMNSRDSGMTSSFMFMVDGEEIAQRFAKAFTHAIKLCQSEKKEPF